MLEPNERGEVGPQHIHFVLRDVINFIIEERKNLQIVSQHKILKYDEMLDSFSGIGG